MPRIPRILISGEPAVYHVMSKTALDGFVLGDQEKDFLLELIKQMSRVFFVEVLGFCIMGNHFHLLVRMLPEHYFNDQEVLRRFGIYYGPDIKPVMTDEKLQSFRQKWSSLSEYMREIKQRFARFYNKKHDRTGYFWGDRFKSVIVENGDTVINCLAYIDLNPVRAGLCSKPEEYRWSSIGYHFYNGMSDSFLSLDFGLQEFGELPESVRLARYRRYLYEKAELSWEEGGPESNVFPLPDNRFLRRTRYFTDSMIIGTKEFVAYCFKRFRHSFPCKKEKIPVPVKGLQGVYSLKRFSE